MGFDSILSLSGTLGVRVNTTGVAVSETVDVNGTLVNIVFSAAQGNVQGFSGSVDLSIAGFVTLSGDFAFEKSVDGATTKILVGAANIDAFLGTSDESMGVQVTDANLGLVLYKTGTAAATYALDASAAAALVGFDSILSLSGTLGVRVNTTGVAVSETVDVNGTLVSIVFSAAQGNVQGFSGSVDLSIAGFVTLSGEFAFEKSVVDTTTKILVGAANIDAFLGTADKSMGVQVTDANLGLVLYKTGTAAATYALDASAAAALVGFDSILSLSGTLGVRVNTTGVAVSETVDVNGTLVSIVFSAAQGNVQGFSGSVDLSIAGFVTLSGEFAFEKSVVDTTTKILVGAANIDAFLGTADKSMGVQVTDANLGLVLYKTGTAAATYALDASAAAALVGFDSILSLSGTLGVRVNTTGVAVSETVDVNGTLVSIVFSAAQGNVQGFSGSVDLSIAGFVTLSGEFAFEKSVVDTTTKILVGAANIDAFLGTADKSMGVQVTDADLGLVLYKTGTAAATYALDASSAAALVGFDSILSLSGTLGVRKHDGCCGQRDGKCQRDAGQYRVQCGAG